MITLASYGRPVLSKAIEEDIGRNLAKNVFVSEHDLG
jgi:hypothetical protein